MTAKEAVNWIINIMADIGKTEHRDLWHYEQALSEIKEMLESQPEQKKGKWIKLYHNNYKCSVCNDWWGCDDSEEVKCFNYCPNCGTKMEDGYGDNNTWN